jgi:protein O-mannosyl-transferase
MTAQLGAVDSIEPTSDWPTADRRAWTWFAVALVTAVFLAYQPAWQGGFVWDDDDHITRTDLRSWEGLYRIWFDLGATPQYYPLTCSVFWIEHRLWGDDPLGYHLVNLALHSAAALMVALILCRLAIPGAFLAAAIFALHPVCVESVAWITELKNTLSIVFYLGAVLCYLAFDRTRRWRWCLATLGLFMLSLMSKTATVTLPAALLVILWWNHGRLSWRRDVLPLVPCFLVAFLGGLLTAWFEYSLTGAQGTSYSLTLVERGLLAGRVVWFYLGKLLWPVDLFFIYPRWTIDSRAWWQYLFPLAALVVLGLLWALRHRWRGPLAGALFFVGTLFPVLGLFNVYFFVYSYVADHFQYVASLGIITLFAAGMALLLARYGLWRRPAGYLLCLGLLGILMVLTWRQSRMYADIDTLYRTTIERNPECAMARNNFAQVLTNRGQFVEAIAEYRKVLELRPDLPGSHYNLAIAMQRNGQIAEAIAEYREAVKMAPGDAAMHTNLGVALHQSGRTAEAIASFEKALTINPDDVNAHFNLAMVMQHGGRTAEAIAHFDRAAALNPDFVPAHRRLAELLAANGQTAAAVKQWRAVLRLQPDDVVAMNRLAWAEATSADASVRNPTEALVLAQWAVQLSGAQRPAMLATLAASYAAAGQFNEAVTTARNARQLALQQNNRALAESLGAQLRLYEAGRPFLETQPAGASRPAAP